jgi:hypothetical protein
VVKRADYAQAAMILRRLLAAVDTGGLDAPGGLYRYVQGAAVAFETAAGTGSSAHGVRPDQQPSVQHTKGV